MISVESKECLSKLGVRLKKARLELNDPQARFAFRLGISIPTLRKMEKGDPTVQIGLWAEVLSILGRLEDWDSLLEKRKSLFDKYEERKSKVRQRASKRKVGS